MEKTGNSLNQFQKRINLEEALTIAYITAALNGPENIRRYSEQTNGNFWEDSFNIDTYSFKITTPDDEEYQITINGINSNGGIKISVERTIRKIYKESYNTEEILSSDELYEKILELLLEPLSRYEIKGEDVLSGKAYGLKPKNSNVSDQIQAFILKLAIALTEGLPGNTEVTKSASTRQMKNVKFTYHVKNKNFVQPESVEFECKYNDSLFPLGSGSRKTNLDEILRTADFSKILEIDLKDKVDIKTSPILFCFMYDKLQERLAEWTKGLKETATIQDVADIIKFRALNNRIIFDHPDFVYIPDMFDEELNAAVEELNKKLGYRGTVFPSAEESSQRPLFKHRARLPKP